MDKEPGLTHVRMHFSDEDITHPAAGWAAVAMTVPYVLSNTEHHLVKSQIMNDIAAARKVVLGDQDREMTVQESKAFAALILVRSIDVMGFPNHKFIWVLKRFISFTTGALFGLGVAIAIIGMAR